MKFFKDIEQTPIRLGRFLFRAWVSLLVDTTCPTPPTHWTRSNPGRPVPPVHLSVVRPSPPMRRPQTRLPALLRLLHLRLADDRGEFAPYVLVLFFILWTATAGALQTEFAFGKTTQMAVGQAIQAGTNAGVRNVCAQAGMSGAGYTFGCPTGEGNAMAAATAVTGAAEPNVPNLVGYTLPTWGFKTAYNGLPEMTGQGGYNMVLPVPLTGTGINLQQWNGGAMLPERETSNLIP